MLDLTPILAHSQPAHTVLPLEPTRVPHLPSACPPAGVLPTHSTFKMMAEHAQRVRAHVLSQPPAAECRLDCWVGVEFGPLHRCEAGGGACVGHGSTQLVAWVDRGNTQLIAWVSRGRAQVGLHEKRACHACGVAPASRASLRTWRHSSTLLSSTPHHCCNRRCEHRPSVCAEQRAHHRKSYEGDSPRLVSHGQPVWTSQAECCRPGLGAFERGCTTTLF